MLDVEISSIVKSSSVHVEVSHNYNPENTENTENTENLVNPVKLSYQFSSGSGRIYVPTLEKSDASVDTSDKNFTLDPTVKGVNIEDTSLSLFYWVRPIPFNEEYFKPIILTNADEFIIYTRLGSFGDKVNFALLCLVLPVDGFGVQWHRELWEGMDSIFNPRIKRIIPAVDAEMVVPV